MVFGMVSHRREEPVDVIGALDEDLQLPAALPAGGQEALGVLEVVVVGRPHVRVVAHDRRDDLALSERRPVVHRDDADEVVAAA